MQLELEKALIDIKIILELYKGTYEEHKYLQQCYNKILESLNQINK